MAPHVFGKQTILHQKTDIETKKSNMWCHLPTSFKRRYVLQLVVLASMIVALTTTLIFAHVTHAVQSTTRTISFQGRLLTSGGAVVSDGFYNIQFKIYQDGSGSAVGNPGGSLKWTESHINNGNATGAVQVKNGAFSVSLGSINSFGSSVDWNADNLWLSMNVAGSAVACTTFGTAPCTADGEMLPMKRITASPYAINSGAVGGKTADNFVQLAQGVQTDASTNTSSIHINKTGSGNLIQLQSAATDIFTVDNTGSLTLGNNSDKLISIATAEDDTSGNHLTIASGNGGGGSGGNGGDLILQGGHTGGANGNGGVVVIDSGNGAGGGGSGTIYLGTANDAGIQIGNTNLGGGTQTIVIGTNENAGGTSHVVVGSGAGSGSGDTTIQAKNSVTIKTNGTDRATFADNTSAVYFGNGVTASAPDDFTIQGTNSSTNDVAGGSLTVQGGNATTGDADGGNVTISGGTASGAGVNGLVVLTTPTFSTVTNDDNCYTSGGLVSSSCTVAQSTVNNSSAAIIGFDTTDQTADIPDPTLSTPGRIFYVMAAGDSEDFTLSLNGGTLYSMQQNTAATLIWNGNDWVIAGASSSVVAQDAFMMMAFGGGDEFLVSDSSDTETPLDSQESSDAPTEEETSGTSENNQTNTNESGLFKLGRAASAPVDADQEALIGSMYYDTTLGKVQCYEAEGWGACGASPDTFVTLSPEYSNAVKNGNGVGTMTSDLCSDALNINDGTLSQPTICGTNETFNFYKWTSAEDAEQTKSIYVTYQLPTTFKEFVPGSTSLMGRTDSVDSKATYQIYRNDKDTGLTECDSVITVSTGNKVTWQKAVANDAADPSNCDFEAGDSIVFRINLSAKKNTNTYVSNLSFTFSNQ